MKKSIFVTLAFASAFLAGCAKFDDPVSETFPDGPSVLVDLVSVADSSATVQITVDTLNTKFFSYAFYNGAQVAPDSLLLLKNAAGGTKTAKYEVGKVAWNNKNTMTVILDKLTPNSEYSFYASGVSSMGMVGATNGVVFKTSDLVSPFLKKAASDSVSLTLTFSENIERGKGAVMAQYFKPYGDIEELFELEDSAFDVSVEGANATVTVNNAPAGAYVLVSWENAAFVDGIGLGCNGQQTVVDEEGEFTNGCYIHMPEVPFEIADSMVVNLGQPFVDWQQTFEIKYDKELFEMYDADDNKAEISMLISGNGYMTLIGSVEWEVSDSSILVYPSKEMAYGEVVGLIIPDGAVCDIYGNPNQLYMNAKLWSRSYGLSREDILGVWDWNYVNAAKVQTVETTVITADPRTENGVFISNLLTGGTCISGTFDGDLALLTIDDKQFLLSAGDYDYYLWAANQQGDIHFQYNLDKDQLVSVEDNYEFGYVYYYQGAPDNWYNYAMSQVVLTRNTTEPKGFTRDMVLNDYVVTFTSALNGAKSTMSFTLEADSTSETGLLLKGLLTSSSVCSAYFDTINSQVVIPCGQRVAYSAKNNYDYILQSYDTKEIVFDVCGDGSMIARAENSPTGMVFVIAVYESGTSNLLGYYEKSASDVSAVIYVEPEDAEQMGKAPMRDIAEMAAPSTKLGNNPVSTIYRPIFMEGPAR